MLCIKVNIVGKIESNSAKKAASTGECTVYVAYLYPAKPTPLPHPHPTPSILPYPMYLPKTSFIVEIENDL